MEDIFLGIDIGAGSFNFIAGTEDDITKQTYRKYEIPSEQDPKIGMRKIIDTAKEFTSGQKLLRVGVGCASADYGYGGMKQLKPANLPQWGGLKVRDILRDELGCNVRLDNDMGTVLFGEYLYGYSNKDMAWISVATGFGVSVVNRGKILMTANGEKPEFGHTLFNPKFDKSQKRNELYKDGARCGCGQINDVESVVSGRGIRNVYGKPPEEIDDQEIWEEIGANLGRVLYNIVHTYAPRLIVLGSGVAVGAGDKLLAPAKRYLEARRDDNSLLLSMPEVKLTKYGNDMNLIGALAFAVTDPSEIDDFYGY